MMNFDSPELKKLKENLTEDSVRSFANGHLSESKRKQLDEILSDKQKLQQMLNSPKAKEIMRKLGGNSGH